jgi:hypothetical protein
MSQITIKNTTKEDTGWTKEITLEREGECDKCDASYDVGSQDNRCGNCGNCGNCCTHKGEGKL